MNRLFFRPDQAGMTKTDAAAQTLQDINPDVAIESFTMNITTLKGFDEFKASVCDDQGHSRVDLVLSCVDNYEARMTINQVCLSQLPFTRRVVCFTCSPFPVTVSWLHTMHPQTTSHLIWCLCRSAWNCSRTGWSPEYLRMLCQVTYRSSSCRVIRLLTCKLKVSYALGERESACAKQWCCFQRSTGQALHAAHRSSYLARLPASPASRPSWWPLASMSAR